MNNNFLNLISRILTLILYGIVGIVVFAVGMLVASVGFETLRVAFSEADYARVALTSVCLSLVCLVTPFSIYYFFIRTRKSLK